ncbi:MAG: Gfo/Idh/MocA family oxidoreductase [Clostridia bacterium]|nr:Gfo/Idh/MocA family oxidoreductase [Clostridia bacterium]
MTKILLVGAGGYAHVYVDFFLSNEDEDIVLEGVVEKYIDSCPQKDELISRGIPLYTDMESFYAEHTADLAIICTPTFLHSPQSICALSHGSCVLCEKPAAPTVEAAGAMIEAEEKYGKWIAIGYQWSFSNAVQKLKRDILAGVFGNPVSFKTAISWPRNKTYYGRGVGWAGRVSRDGVMILDSIAANACAHYLHNMFFLLGKTMDSSASAQELDAVLLRANDIENFDTCSLKMKTAEGVDCYFIASHAAENRRDPEFVYSFENATVTFGENGVKEIIAKFSDGRTVSYGDPFGDGIKKLTDCIHAVNNSEVPICTVKTAFPHTRVIQRLYDDFSVNNFPSDLVHYSEEEDRVYVEGLYDELFRAYEGEDMLDRYL